MMNMKYCRTENVIAALREWEDDPGTDEHLHHELYKLCSRILEAGGLLNGVGDFRQEKGKGNYGQFAADAGLVPDMTANARLSGAGTASA